ncbi:MAG: DJ-1/PfpI family protein [Mycobacterium leprae]
MTARRILMLVGDYVEDAELLESLHVLQMAGHLVHTICPNRSAGDLIRTATHAQEGEQTYCERPGRSFPLNWSFDDVRPETYDALVIPGGRSPEYIRLNQRVLEIVRHFASAGKPIAAIAHGPQVLVAADVIEGRTISGSPHISPDIRRAGARFAEAADSRAEVDGNLYTASSIHALPDLLQRFLSSLGTNLFG